MTSAIGDLSVDNPAYCPLRWSYLQVDLANARAKACCKTPFQTLSNDELARAGGDAIFNSDYVRSRRLEMLRGAQHVDCASCHSSERDGLTSYRQSEASKPLHATVTQRLRAQPTLSGMPLHLEVLLRTTCNLACSYCGPDFSSRWQREIERHGAYPEDGGVPLSLPEARPEFAATFHKWLEGALDSLRYIQINGGEPLIQSDFYKLLSVLLRREDVRPQLGLITNLSAPPRRLGQFLALLPALHERHGLRLAVSLDTVGRKLEYIRFGLRWPRVDANIRAILSVAPTLEIHFAPTMSALNITSIGDIIEYAVRVESEQSARIHFRPGIVQWPDFQSPLLLLKSDYRHLETAIRTLERLGRWTELRRRLEEIAAVSPAPEALVARRAAFFRWFSEYDRRRGTDFLSTFPELTRFWLSCESASRQTTHPA